MALFRKNQSTTTNIPELQEYYANQQKESTGKAWLLAIGSLLVTVVVLVGAFFGGRWAYRKLTKKNKATTATSQVSESSNNIGASATSTTPTPTPPATTTPTATTPTTTATQSTSSTVAQGVSTTQSTATNTSAKAASTSVPNTGPGDTIGLFVLITTVSYYLHRTYVRRKLNK